MSEPLLETPDLDAAMAVFVDEAVQSLMAASDPIFASLGRSALPEGVAAVRVEAAGAEIDSPEVHMQHLVEMTPDDVLSGELERFHDVLAQIADSHVAQFMREFFEYVGGAAEAVGNSLDLSGENLTWDAILDAYERVEWMPDHLDVVRPPRITAGSVAAARLGGLPPPTDEQRHRAGRLALDKQEAHVSRRRSRRLR